MSAKKNRYLKSEHSLSEVRKIGWTISENLFEKMSKYEKTYFFFEFASPWSPSSYTQRLKRIGFSGLGSILDVGCGMGQWSYSLAAMNESVTGIDTNIERLAIAKNICEEAKIKNADFLSANATSLPFENETFDAIFCYSMIMFVPIQSVLLEFNRVLKFGGKLYINVDSRGYYLKLLRDSLFKTLNFGMALTCIKFIARGLFRKDVFAAIEPKRLGRILTKTGFETLAIAPEGMVWLAGDEKAHIKYQKDFMLLPYVTEAVAVKLNGTSHTN